MCSLFSYTELRTWWRGTESQHFSVEKGISHELQLNLDMVVNMPCSEINVNIQDASGDRILAGDLLTREETSWMLWMQQRNYEIHTGVTEYQHLSSEDEERLSAQEEDVHVHHVLGEVRRNPWRKFPRGPRLRRSDVKDSCRVFGSLEGNKVQGDFHITARGHGYHDFGKHLDHSGLFFSLPPPSLASEGELTRLKMESIQLHPLNNRTFLRPSLPNIAQSTRQNNRRSKYPLLQIPILSLDSTNTLQQKQKRSRRIHQLPVRRNTAQEQPEHNLHEPVRGNEPEWHNSRIIASDSGHLLQV